MGTVVERRRKDNSTAYMAKITIKRDGVVAISEAKTFDRRAAALAWIARREEELAVPGAIERSKIVHVTLADVIDRYTAESIKTIGRTKAQVLGSIKELDIASLRCDQITSEKIVELARQLSAGRKPATVSNYLSHLAAIFAIAKPAWGYPLDQQAMDGAFKVASRLGLTGKSDERERRPTLEELDKIMTHFSGRRSNALPMTRVVAFALFSARRESEITRLAWADYEPDANRIKVRDMKDPRDKIGNHMWLELPEPAKRIIDAMPKTAPQIFPYDPDSISANFTRACQFLEIEDLRFHDLRHEGVSRLFEIGLNIPRVAAVSGHRSWSALKRYAHLRQTGDKYAGWKWLDVVTEPLPQTPEPDPYSGMTYRSARRQRLKDRRSAQQQAS